MPPKKPVKKVDEKKMLKVIEDKTFGLKNKKGAKMQKYISQLQNQVKGNAKTNFQNKKKDAEDDLKDLNKLLKPVQCMPKIGQDVDPKSVLCVFFKQGMCQKGNKCKFSHDLAVQQKTAKRNLYFDSRDAKKDDENQETNENWDEKQLTEVAEKKHGEKDRKRVNQTEIVCKYFIEAVENTKYGWFWECPNGETCIYRHALPPGYVLKKDKKRIDELNKLDKISLEELIEKERSCLSSKNCTKVTLESFIAWKKRKLREKQKKASDDEKQKRTNFKFGKQNGLSGRELFTFNPDLIGDDDEEANDIERERDTENQENEIKAFEINEQTFLTLDDGKRLDEFDDEVEENDVEQANGESSNLKSVEFDENLFDGEDLPDLSSDEDIDKEDCDAPPPGYESLKQTDSSEASKKKTYNKNLSKTLSEKLNV